MKQEPRKRIPVRIRVEDEKGFEKTIVFRQGLLRIGSEPEAGLCLRHESVAPCHLLILREGERFTFADTSAGMTTLVNGLPAHKGILKHGDVITFGEGCPYKLTFLVDSLRAGDRRERKLRGLLAASRAINSSLVLGEVLEKVMDSALAVTGAEKGFLMLVEADGTLKPYVSRNIDGDTLRGKMIPASRTMIRKAVESRRSVHYVSGSQGEPTDPETASIVRLKLETVMCTPILAGGEPIGVIYLDHRGVLESIPGEDIEILEALADQASVAIENARLSERMLLSERLSAVGRMVSCIVHDLRGPLTGIRAAIQLMRTDLGGPQGPRLLELIDDESVRLTEMAEEVLEFCRGRMTLNMEAVSIRAFMDGLVRTVQTELSSRSIRVNARLSDDAKVRLDVRRMERVFRNLIGNAADAMEDGGQVGIVASVAGDRMVITVTDSGCGMTDEIRRRAFEPFYTSGKKGGTGLGMAIAARIIEAHEGAVEIDSAPGRGTTIRILLPLAPESAATPEKQPVGAVRRHAPPAR
jgi:signal transduction histidine kinase